MTPEYEAFKAGRKSPVHWTEVEQLASEHGWPDHANHCKTCGNPIPCPTERLIQAYRELLTEISHPE